MVHLVSPTTVTVEFQSLELGVLRRFFCRAKKPERNCNAGTLEPWALMLGCKVGLLSWQCSIKFRYKPWNFTLNTPSHYPSWLIGFPTLLLFIIPTRCITPYYKHQSTIIYQLCPMFNSFHLEPPLFGWLPIPFTTKVRFLIGLAGASHGLERYPKSLVNGWLPMVVTKPG